jgi:endoglucanase
LNKRTPAGNYRLNLITILLSIVLIIFLYFAYNYIFNGLLYKNNNFDNINNSGTLETIKINDSPLKDKKLYIDKDGQIHDIVNNKIKVGNTLDAELLNIIASQPQAIWLTGPTETDPNATKDNNLISRTSLDASIQQALPVYVLYAIPNRDACAGYSGNSTISSESYLIWLEKILDSLDGEAVFIVEPDAIAHAVMGGCLNDTQTQERFALLNQIATRLGENEKVMAAYLEAGHSDWFPDSDILVEPLKRAGVDKLRGIVLNVSFFESTQKIKPWAQQLVSKIGDNKAAIIDTSRNGNGVPPDTVTGENRWCNPPGRALGQNPSTQTDSPQIDAYLWIKRPGESDGSCGNNPPAGVFSETIAKDLANNTKRN